MNFNNITAWLIPPSGGRKLILSTSSPCVKTNYRREDDPLNSYLVGFLMCWEKAIATEVSDSLQLNDVIDDPTSKFTQFIHGASESPTRRLLPLLQ
ncbi:unnamed protein product [Schistosoma curassoni]|uniref:Uncharacterized protein n=1 Tax=Schistosoma curassoni TaxID=6186 RepID=A0A183KDN0_9TREM|nr:unnamed protein product [Schistosoma curassoni]